MGVGIWQRRRLFSCVFNPGNRHLSDRGAGRQTTILPAGWAGARLRFLPSLQASQSMSKPERGEKRAQLPSTAFAGDVPPKTRRVARRQHFFLLPAGVSSTRSHVRRQGVSDPKGGSLPAPLRSWLDNVVVPDLVRDYLAEMRNEKEDCSTAERMADSATRNIVSAGRGG